MKSQRLADQAQLRADACSTPGRLERGFAKLLRRIVTTNWILYSLVGLLVGVSLLASLYTGDWHWFQRSGALVVSAGAVLSTQRALTVILDDMAGAPRPGLAARTGPAASTRNLQELRTCVCGFMLVAMGTLIWAYGDLFGCLLDWILVCLADSGNPVT